MYSFKVTKKCVQSVTVVVDDAGSPIVGGEPVVFFFSCFSTCPEKGAVEGRL